MTKIANQLAPLFEGKGVNGVIKRVCGPMIGSGQFRDVYELRNRPEYVVKIERDVSKGNFCNVTEWKNFINNQHWPFLSKWLAPCELINETGNILVQRRVYWEGKMRKDYPTHVPAMFTDLKLTNFGWLKNGQFVCCDYAFLIPAIVSPEKEPMRYAKWRGSIKHLNTTL